MKKDYYAILGVDRSASFDQIKLAYRERIDPLHPDLLEADSLALVDIQEAYTVLSDPLRRKAYDWIQHGSGRPMATQRIPPEEPLIPPDRRTDLGEISLTESFHTFRPSFEDLMNRLFSNFFDLTRPKAETIESLNIEILLTPEEALRGGQARVLIPTLTPCPTCAGHGRVGPFECWHCKGKGAVVKEYPVMIHYPAGISNYVVEVSLDRFGIRNFYLTVYFRVGE